jgi:hypothetical protein
VTRADGNAGLIPQPSAALAPASRNKDSMQDVINADNNGCASCREDGDRTDKE